MRRILIGRQCKTLGLLIGRTALVSGGAASGGPVQISISSGIDQWRRPHRNIPWTQHQHSLSRQVKFYTYMLYYAIHILYYAIHIWTCTNESLLKSLFIKQKQAIRIISGSKYNAHTEPLFKKLNILPFPDLVRFYTFINKSDSSVWYKLTGSKLLTLATGTLIVHNKNFYHV